MYNWSFHFNIGASFWPFPQVLIWEILLQTFGSWWPTKQIKINFGDPYIVLQYMKVFGDTAVHCSPFKSMRHKYGTMIRVLEWGSKPQKVVAAHWLKNTQIERVRQTISDLIMRPWFFKFRKFSIICVKRYREQYSSDRIDFWGAVGRPLFHSVCSSLFSIGLEIIFDHWNNFRKHFLSHRGVARNLAWGCKSIFLLKKLS